MARKDRLQQQRAILAHRAHLNLLRGMAAGIQKILPEDLSFLIVTFNTKSGRAGGYVSNGRHRSISAALKTLTRSYFP